MPVLGEEQTVKPAGQLIDDREHGVGIGHGQRSPSAEVGLDINDHKGCLLHGVRNEPSGWGGGARTKRVFEDPD